MEYFFILLGIYCIFVSHFEYILSFIYIYIGDLNLLYWKCFLCFLSGNLNRAMLYVVRILL